MSVERGLQPFGPAGGELGGIPGSGQRAADERAYLWLVIDDQDAIRMRHCHLPAERVLSVCSLAPLQGVNIGIRGWCLVSGPSSTIDCAKKPEGRLPVLTRCNRLRRSAKGRVTGHVSV